MNHCKKISYHLYTSTSADFRTAITEVIEKLPSDRLPLRLIFFHASNHPDTYSQQTEALSWCMQQHFGENQPAWSLVTQPPLTTLLVLEAHLYVPDLSDSIVYHRLNNHPYTVLYTNEGKFVYAGGCSGQQTDEYQQQAIVSCQQAETILTQEDMQLTDIVRQWNYLPHITDTTLGNQHYQLFNNARSASYQKDTWKNGYPAATGIGMDQGAVTIDFDAVKLVTPHRHAPIDNSLQIAAYAYSPAVLSPTNQQQTTPKFERARILQTGTTQLIYISGTASIRGEETIGINSIEQQLGYTMENIRHLTSGHPFELMRVYLKHPHHLPLVQTYLHTHYPHTSILYVQADVCRPNLLIEIEGIAR